MNDYEILETMNDNREFRYSIGYYSIDSEGENALAWHNCKNKPMYLSCSDFSHIQTEHYVCPVCGQPILRWELMDVDEEQKDDVFIRFASVNLVRVTTDGFKVSVGVVESRYNMWWNDFSVFAKSTYYRRVTMNVKTGYSYQFETAILSKKGGLDKQRRLTNISYRGSSIDLPRDALDYVNILIGKRVKMIHGENVPAFESYNNELSLGNLIFYVRNPYICPLLYNGIINKSRRTPYDAIRHKELLVKNDCNDPLQQVFSQSRIPKVKSLKRIAYTDTNSFPLLASISRNFQNVDIIRSLYAAYINCLDYEYGSYIDFSARIFKIMIRHKGEKNIASKLLTHRYKDKNNNAYRTLFDMIRCYDEIKHCDFDFTKNYSIDELHLYLTAVVSYRERQNRKIDYAESELLLEMSDDTFFLSLAKDTHELVSVGEEMHMCVGAYANEAVNKSCTILVLWSYEEHRPVGCIEVQSDTVTQVKGSHNRLLQDQERQFVERWIRCKCLAVGTVDLRFD